MCAASRNFRPPYLTNGILRRASSTSSTSLALALRNSTAWRRSGTPASRRLRISPQTYSACRPDHRTVTYSGRPPRAARRQQVLAMLARRLGHQRIGDIQHRLGRAVVLRQRDDLGAAAEALREIQDVLDRRGAKRIDRLRIVAHHRQPRAVRLQGVQDLGLQPVGVLVLIDQHVIEVAADVLRQLRLAHHHVPVEQQIVVVEQRVALLALDVAAKQPGQILFPVLAPGKLLLERLAAAASAY